MVYYLFGVCLVVFVACVVDFCLAFGCLFVCLCGLDCLLGCCFRCCVLVVGLFGDCLVL